MRKLVKGPVQPSVPQASRGHEAAASAQGQEDRPSQNQTPAQTALPPVRNPEFPQWTPYDTGHLEALRKKQLNMEMRSMGETTVGQEGINAQMGPVTEAYRNRHPETHYKFARNYHAMMEDVKSNQATLADGKPLHYTVKDTFSAHTTAWRVQPHDGKIVALGVDSLGAQDGSAITAQESIRSQMQSDPGPISRVALINTGVQKDPVSCGIYDKTVIDNFRKHPDEVDPLLTQAFPPEKGKRERFGHSSQWFRKRDPVTVYGEQQAQGMLHPRFFKNAQSKAMLTGYLNGNPAAANALVNQKGESIEPRLQRLTGSEKPLETADRMEMTRPIEKAGHKAVSQTIEYLEAKQAYDRSLQPPPQIQSNL